MSLRVSTIAVHDGEGTQAVAEALDSPTATERFESVK
jgi:hypothetical protein